MSKKAFAVKAKDPDILKRSSSGGAFSLFAEEIIAGVRVPVFADRVHIDAQLLPLLIVADRAGAKALCAGAGNHIFTGKAVAHRAGAALAYAGSGLLQSFLISHFYHPPVSCIHSGLIVQRRGKKGKPPAI